MNENASRDPISGMPNPRVDEIPNRINLALIWHQHQPLYRDLVRPSAQGSYRMPWVRLHALRDYYGMAALISQFPSMRLTINFSPCLLWQLDDYVFRGATDEALDLSLTPAETLTPSQTETMLSTFFEGDWHNQIFPHPRYRELFDARKQGRRFSSQDLRDLQMWFNLAWFGKEFRESEVRLVTGDVVSVGRFVEKERGFTCAEIRSMVEDQLKILRAVVPLHRKLQDEGQVEISVTPFFHPILPLLIDTDRATVDRPGTTLPRRFHHSDDAHAQMASAAADYAHRFGQSPRGAWPAEGAVSQSSIPCFAKSGIRWIASDQGVLARSGRWGYRVEDPAVRHRAYRAEEGPDAVAVLFRDTELSDDIGFHCQADPDPEAAVREWVGKVKARAASRDADRLVTIVLDGENAWGAYREDGRPFLTALYRTLAQDPAIRTVTPSEFLEASDRILPKVYDLFTGSWIDEMGSAPGVDLGTWIGEDEENRAWDLLGDARDFLVGRELTEAAAPAAFQALYAAEGSDWFWWYGDDQDSGHDADFDELFRLHLAAVYGAAGQMAPTCLDLPIVPREAVWTFARQVGTIAVGDRLTIRTNCPGVVTWSTGGPPTEAVLPRVGGVMAGLGRHQLALGPFLEAGQVEFHFRCTHQGCDCTDGCCSTAAHLVSVVARPTA